MFGIGKKVWCPESVRKVLQELPPEFSFCFYGAGSQKIAFADFRELGVRIIEVRFADTLSYRHFFLPQGRISPEWCQQVIAGVADFVANQNYIPIDEAKALGQEIITRLQLGKEAETDDPRNVVMYLGKYPMEHRRRILQFLLELDEDAPWAVVEFHLYQVSAAEAERTRTALDIMESVL